MDKKFKPEIEVNTKSPYFGTVTIDESGKEKEGEGDSLTPYNSDISLSGIYNLPESVIKLVLKMLQKNSKNYISIIERYAEIGKVESSKDILLACHNLYKDNKNSEEIIKNFKTNQPINPNNSKPTLKIKQSGKK